MKTFASAAFLLAWLVIDAGAALPADRVVSYTSDQAWSGRLTYDQHCAECHGGGLEGQFGPALAGPDGRTQWESGQYVFAYMSTHMPHGDPGSLSTREYVDIMAFIYQQHRRPASRRPLTRAQADGDKTLLGL